jgi:hypothetical protein
VKEGQGQLNFNYAGTNDFDGLIIRGGIVSQGTWNSTFGNADAPIIFEGGTLRQRANTGMGTTPNLTNPLHIQEGTENTLIGSYRANIRGKVTGSGQLTFQSGGIRNYIYSDFSDFEGTLIATGAEMLLQSTVADMSRATLQPTGSVAVSPSASELMIGTLGSIEREPAVKGTTVSVGYRNEDATYAGKLTGTTVNKYGTGIWELTGVASTAGINVKEGTLRIRNFSGTTTTSSLTVESGARLIGRGNTQSILLRKGSTIAPGVDDNTTGTLATTGNFIAYGGSTLCFKVSQSGNDKVKTGGTMRLMGDTIRIQPIDGRTFTEGESIQIFDGTVNASSKWVIDGAGYDWDDSLLISSGTLVCKGEVTGIGSIAAGEPDSVRYFDATGMEVAPKQMRRHQVYIERTVKNGQVRTLKIRK